MEILNPESFRFKPGSSIRKETITPWRFESNSTALQTATAPYILDKQHGGKESLGPFLLQLPNLWLTGKPLWLAEPWGRDRIEPRSPASQSCFADWTNTHHNTAHAKWNCTSILHHRELPTRDQNKSKMEITLNPATEYRRGSSQALTFKIKDHLKPTPQSDSVCSRKPVSAA